MRILLQTTHGRAPSTAATLTACSAWSPSRTWSRPVARARPMAASGRCLALPESLGCWRSCGASRRPAGSWPSLSTSTAAPRGSSPSRTCSRRLVGEIYDEFDPDFRRVDPTGPTARSSCRGRSGPRPPDLGVSLAARGRLRHRRRADPGAARPYSGGGRQRRGRPLAAGGPWHGPQRHHLVRLLPLAARPSRRAGYRLLLRRRRWPPAGRRRCGGAPC